MSGGYKSLIAALAFFGGVGSLCAYASRSSAATRDCSALSSSSTGAWVQCGNESAGNICASTDIYDNNGNNQSTFYASNDCIGSTSTSYGPFPFTPGYTVITLHNGHRAYTWASTTCTWPNDCWAPSNYNAQTGANAVWINAHQSGGTYGNCSWQPFAAIGGGCD